MFIDKSKETNILRAESVLKTGPNVRLTQELENSISVVAASCGDGTELKQLGSAGAGGLV